MGNFLPTPMCAFNRIAWKLTKYCWKRPPLPGCKILFIVKCAVKRQRIHVRSGALLHENASTLAPVWIKTVSNIFRKCSNRVCFCSFKLLLRKWVCKRAVAGRQTFSIHKNSNSAVLTRDFVIKRPWNETIVRAIWPLGGAALIWTKSTQTICDYGDICTAHCRRARVYCRHVAQACFLSNVVNRAVWLCEYAILDCRANS